jgi:hypothetical protein
MNKELETTLKEFYKVQREVDELSIILKELKGDLEQQIIKANLVDKKFSVGDRQVCYKKTETAQALSQQYIVSCLDEYFRDKPREAEALMQFILENRKKKSNFALEVIKKKPIDTVKATKKDTSKESREEEIEE